MSALAGPTELQSDSIQLNGVAAEPMSWDAPDQHALSGALAIGGCVWFAAGAALALSGADDAKLGFSAEAAGLIALSLGGYLWLGQPSDAARGKVGMLGAGLATGTLLVCLALAGETLLAFPICLSALLVMTAHEEPYVGYTGLGLCLMGMIGALLSGADSRALLCAALSSPAAVACGASFARRRALQELLRRRDVRQLDLQRQADALRKNLHELNSMADPSQTLEVRGELDGMWEWNLETDKVYLSPRWRSLLGYPDASTTMTSEKWLDLIHPYDLDEFLRRIGAHLDKKATVFECEHRIRQADQSYRWVLSNGRAIWDYEGRPQRIAGSQVDIKRMKNYEAELVHQATHDKLTALPNRAYLLEQLTATLKRHDGTLQDSFALAFVDLDRFKSINDRFGHAVGDALLVEVARRIQEACGREESVIARLGGDEFVVLLKRVRRRRAMVLVEAIERSLSRPILAAGRELTISASIGVALAEDQLTSPDALLRQADLAMYQAKADGKGCSRVFEPYMEEKAASATDLAESLRTALLQNQFELFYQPIVSLHTGRVESVEALIRWRREDGRIVSPGEFIPFAEESDLIVEIGDWVLGEACRQIEEWWEEGVRPVKVSVNLSVKQLAQPGFAVALRERLRSRGVEPDSLQLEITETGLLQELGSTVESLDRLIFMGIGTAIDDFGTGYSSLSYLRQLNCDIVKMDRSFVQDLAEDTRSEALSRSIISMAHNLGLRVVAEGVETVDQLRVLRSQGCNFVQGYLIAKPMASSKMGPFLRSRWSLFHHHPSSRGPLPPAKPVGGRAAQLEGLNEALQSG